MRRIGIFLFLLTSTVPATAIAQTAPRPKPKPAPVTDDSGADEPDIIVMGQRNLPGAVIGDIPPEQQLGPSDIRSYGVSSLSDLVNELSPQTQSDRGSGGAPVVLLNGKRISSFAEIRDIPTEAIARVDILPEEVALKYGYPADQKVINVVLRRRFRAVTIEAADKEATAGGRNTPEGEFDILHIRNGGRLNLHTSYTANSALTEDERTIPATTATGLNGATIDQQPYRTLLPSSRDLAVNLVYAKTILGNVSASVNGRIEASDSIGLNGLPTISLDLPVGSPFSAPGEQVNRVVDGYRPLTQKTSTIAAHFGTTLNGTMGKWQWSVTGVYDRTDSETFTDAGFDATTFQDRIKAGDPTANPFGPLANAGLTPYPLNRAHSTANSGGLDALFNGTLFTLPAGAISTSVRVGGSLSGLDSQSNRLGVAQTADITRNIVNGQVNVDVPLTSKAKGFLGAIGTLSVNFNLAEDHLSDFGDLRTIGYGANWTPFEGVRLLASATDQDQAPSAVQLGNPNVTTPNVRVFDYLKGTTANVTTVSGGNPGLIADTNHVKKLELTVKPLKKTDLTFVATYVSTRTEDPIAAFPSATAAIEAAFPGRFTRDNNGVGVLTQIDMRPINFAESERSSLRWGINFSRPLKSKIQKEFEAFRAGTGPNPFAGIQLPRDFQRPGGGRGGDNPGGAPPPPGGGQDGSSQGNGATAGSGGGPPGGGAGGGGGGGRRGGGGFGGRGGGAGGGRLQFAVYHTWHITDSVLVKNGGPRLDLLNGDAIGSSGGQSRHEFEVQAGYSNNGLGFRLSGNYKTGTTVNGGTPTIPDRLHFSGLGTADIRLFADLGQRLDLLKAHPWLRGVRLSLAVTNIFDSKQRVTNAAGGTPVSYEPDYLDPLGRAVRLSIRKLFF